MNTIIAIIIEFFKTGLFSIGGGLATLPFLREIAEKYPWFTIDELTDMIAISESTPGPIGVNMSTYAGFKAMGLFGGILATLSLVAPSVIIVIAVSKMLERFKENKYVEAGFYGVRPASIGLIAAAMFDVFLSVFLYVGANDAAVHQMLINIKSVIVFIVFFVLMYKLQKLHPVVFIAAGAVVGIVLY